MGNELHPPFGGRFIVQKALKSKCTLRGVTFRLLRWNLGNSQLVDLWNFWQRNCGTGAMNDWLIFVGWLATAASFLFLSVLVLFPVN